MLQGQDQHFQLFRIFMGKDKVSYFHQFFLLKLRRELSFTSLSTEKMVWYVSLIYRITFFMLRLISLFITKYQQVMPIDIVMREPMAAPYNPKQYKHI